MDYQDARQGPTLTFGKEGITFSFEGATGVDERSQREWKTFLPWERIDAAKCVALAQQESRVCFDWERIETPLVASCSGQNLLERAKYVDLIGSGCAGYAVIAEICKRFSQRRY